MSNPKRSRVNVSDNDQDHQDLDFSSTEFEEEAAEDMNGYNVSKQHRQIYENAMNVLARSEHWNPNYSRRTASTSIVSSSSDEPTIDLNNVNTQYKFNPSEITGRSTATNDTSMSVEQILCESQCSDVRAMAEELRRFKIRESQGGEQLAYTADVSLASSKSFRSSMSKPDDWDLHNQNSSGSGSDIFMPSDRVKAFLESEEHVWAQEYATLPPDSDVPTTENSKKTTFELADLSRLAYESGNESNASFGQFFIKRSENLLEMLPNISPTRTGKPMALIDSVNTTQDTNVGNTKIISSPSTNRMSARDGESFIDQAAIQSFFQKCNEFSPATVTNNLMKLKKPRATPAPITSSTAMPMESLPLKPLQTKPNVNVLKVEKFNGNVSALRTHLSNIPIPVQSALLTPGGHIRRKDFNKENENSLRHDEINFDKHLLSDTLSMSGLLSSSKVQGNSTKTSLEDEGANSVPVALNDVVNQTIDAKTNETHNTTADVTPTNSPQRNRKRTRSNERAMLANATPPRTLNALDVYYNTKHRLTPSPRTQSNSSTPPRTLNALDVYYNSKHRLTPSPRTQSNSSTPDTPRSRANLNVLFSRTQETPSPNRSGNSTPVGNSQHSNGLYSTHSTNFLGPSVSNMRNLDHHLRSPKLLAQSNSQFSSVSDLREFAIKSSQSVISWPSQKLRTPSVKQFTIKNIGGKKLTMKIEVVGPGFQLSPSEPFQLIALQAQECRTISVTFCPIALGAAVGKLNFCHAKDTADKTIRKIIPLYGYGGHTVVEVQDVCQGVVGNPFLQLGTVGDLLNLQMHGAFSIYNKGPLSGVAIIRVKSDLKKPSGSSHYAALTLTPSKCVIGPDSYSRIDIAYRPRKNDVRKLLRQEGNVLAVATLEVFMADEPSRQRILGLINKFANNSSDIYLLDELFRGISTDVVENFAEFQETEDMIAELFNKMKTTEIVLTVKRSTMDQTIESEHDFFMSDTNESMFFHTLVSDDALAGPSIPAMITSVKTAASSLIPSSSSTLHHPVQRSERSQPFNWYLNKTEIRINPSNFNDARSQIDIVSKSRSQQMFEIDSNCPHVFTIEPDCGVISPGSTATVNVSLKNTNLTSDEMFIRIRVDKKQDAIVPVVLDK